ncbi:DUF6888 family protein [Chroococcidiopsis sp.]
MPTTAKTLRCYILSCWATRMYLPVNLVCFDARNKNIFMLIGEENEIEID